MKPVALITGASSGIGQACARLLASMDYDLILSARRAERLEELAAELKQSFGSDILVLPLDVRNRTEVESTLASLSGKWKEFSLLINNAGLALGLSPIDKGDTDHWDTMIDTNVKGLLYVTKASVPSLVASGKGQIINIGSIAGKEVYANGNVYCASKFAVDALNKAMRIDLAHYPVKVSAIHPGAVETEFSLVRFEGDSQKAAAVYQGFENLVAEDIAEAVRFIVTRPQHVNINEMVIMPTAQPAAGIIHRKTAGQ